MQALLVEKKTAMGIDEYMLMIIDAAHTLVANGLRSQFMIEEDYITPYCDYGVYFWW